MYFRVNTNFYRMACIKYFVLAIILCGYHANTKAQDSLAKADLMDLHAFFGRWSGDLLILKEGDTLQKVSMTLSIVHDKSNGNLSWKTVFDGPQQKITKPYVVEAGDAPGSYLVDEGNSIKIPHYLNGQIFTGFYKVLGRFFMTENRLIGDTEMLFTITVIPEKPALISGKTVYEGQEIPEVEALGISMLQVARLEKVLE